MTETPSSAPEFIAAVEKIAGPGSVVVTR
jgi:hypothetical protein